MPSKVKSRGSGGVLLCLSCYFVVYIKTYGQLAFMITITLTILKPLSSNSLFRRVVRTPISCRKCCLRRRVNGGAIWDHRGGVRPWVKTSPGTWSGRVRMFSPFRSGPARPYEHSRAIGEGESPVVECVEVRAYRWERRESYRHEKVTR